MSDLRPTGDLKESHTGSDEPVAARSSAGPTGSPGSVETPAVPEVNVPKTSAEPEKGIVEDPVEILVRMAERGEIDPWNIDIIEVTDKFLTELDRCRQLNLQLSGRTLFFAATLLRMKSEHLELLDVTEEEGAGEDDDSFGDEFGSALDSEAEYSGRLGPIERLEHEIQRRLDRKNMRKSPVTLFELILELKNIEKEERRRRRMNIPGADDSLFDADDVVGIAHDEGYQESSMTTLMEYLEGIEVDGEMTLAELCTTLGWGIPEVYIPLLFLALDGRCSLRQEEFFGDIFVQICRAEVEVSLPEVPAE
jgi:segregation and condensation protein A